MKGLVLGSVGLTMAIGLGAAQGAVVWTASYEADVLPEAGGSISYSSGETDSFAPVSGPPVNASVTGGNFAFSTLGGGSLSAFYTTPSESDNLSLNSDIGYTVEWRARIFEANVAGANNTAAIQIDEDRAGVDRFWNLEMFRDADDQYYVTLTNTTGESVTAPIDAGVFYTYRVTVLASGATLYLNDNPIPLGSIASFRALGTNNIRFGDLAGGENASFETDYIRIFDGGAVAPVPEPVGTATLALVSMAALVRRRRR